MVKEKVMYIIVNPVINVSCGKLCSQVAHAAILSFVESKELQVKKWTEEGQKKIVLKPYVLTEYTDLKLKLRSEKIKYFTVTDAGRTWVEPNTETCFSVEVGDHTYMYSSIFKNTPIL